MRAVGPAPSRPRALSSPWQKSREHRDRDCARRTRRSEGAYREYVTEEQRSPRTMQTRSNAVTTFATGCQVIPRPRFEYF